MGSPETLTATQSVVLRAFLQSDKPLLDDGRRIPQ